MKKLLTLLLLTVSALLHTTAHAQQAAAYAVADATTGHILSAANPTKKLQIGSLTNIATAMVVLDWAELTRRDLGTMATVPGAVVGVGGANPVGFQPGDQVSLRDLLYATLLQSDNIAAYTLADYVGHSLQHGQPGVRPVDLFVAQMNALSRKLGMQHTVFLNPHGLDVREHPYSTAADLVLLTKYALQRPAFRFFVAQKNRRITRTLPEGEPAQYDLVNTNELLGVDAIDGVKTGKTLRAGECAIISAARAPESVTNPNGSVTITPRRLMVIVLGAADRFSLAQRLLNQGWNLYDGWAAAGRPLGKNG